LKIGHRTREFLLCKGEERRTKRKKNRRTPGGRTSWRGEEGSGKGLGGGKDLLSRRSRSRLLQEKKEKGHWKKKKSATRRERRKVIQRGRRRTRKKNKTLY